MQPSAKPDCQPFLFVSDASPSDVDYENASSKKSHTSHMHQPRARIKTRLSPQKPSMHNSDRGKFVESSDEKVSHRNKSVHPKYKGKIKSYREFRGNSLSARYSSNDGIYKRQITASFYKHARSQKLTWDSPSVEVIDDVDAREFQDQQSHTRTKVSTLLFSYETTHSKYSIDGPSQWIPHWTWTGVLAKGYRSRLPHLRR